MTTVAKAGRYEIVGEVGRGAMGVVYKAVDPVIGRTVAVKTIRLSEQGTGLSRPELLSRFQTEARAAGLLTHPNIVVVYDAGEENGLYYITMELVEGKSVQALLDEGQRFSLPRVLRIMEQTCSALDFAHERHVVHRDIKPANLMLTADDTVKVTDFGTAKILQFGTVQQTTHVMGTPSYMSPEQVKGRAVDGRSDIFSLGVMLYEMVTGEKPFPGQNITTVIYKIVNEDPVPPRQLDPSIHPGINAVIMKALCKEPDERYQTCRELLEDLRDYRSNAGLAGSPQSTRALGGGASPAATVAMGGEGRVAHSPNEGHGAGYVAAPAGSLASRANSPGQTPVIRRTGSVPPVPAPEKPISIFTTVLVTLLLVGVIAWGAYKLQPVFLAAREFHEAEQAHATPKLAAGATASAITKPQPTTDAAAGSPAVATGNTSTPVAPAGAIVPAESPKSAESFAANPTEVPAPKAAAIAPAAEAAKPAPSLSPRASEYKSRIDGAIAERGLTGRAKVQGVGNTLTISGKLRPAEHGALLKFLRDAPAELRMIDHIEYDDTPVTSAAGADEGSHPVPTPDRGAIHVVTDVIGANATLYGPAGRQLRQCQTPCSFNGLQASGYSLEVKKDGYRTVQTALQVKVGEVVDQKVRLESIAIGLMLVSDPPGADVFINGAKQPGQTPVALPLAAGQYNLVLRLQGYTAYAGNVLVKDNIQTQFSVQLRAKDAAKVAWADIATTPPGAEIVVDGTTTSQFAPSRVQLPTGLHIITLKMKGFEPVRRTVQVSEGGTVSLNEALRAVAPK
ncbi:MAG: protein kinase [Candidatus Acidiferrum sp.]|jgi:serine/threonine-protein kinase